MRCRGTAVSTEREWHGRGRGEGASPRSLERPRAVHAAADPAVISVNADILFHSFFDTENQTQTLVEKFWETEKEYQRVRKVLNEGIRTGAPASVLELFGRGFDQSRTQGSRTARWRPRDVLGGRAEWSCPPWGLERSEPARSAAAADHTPRWVLLPAHASACAGRAACRAALMRRAAAWRDAAVASATSAVREARRQDGARARTRSFVSNTASPSAATPPRQPFRAPRRA